MRKKIRSLKELKEDYPFVSERAEQIREAFGAYYGLKIFDNDELVYSWSKAQERVPETAYLDPKWVDREPHLWYGQKRKKK